MIFGLEEAAFSLFACLRTRLSTGEYRKTQAGPTAADGIRSLTWCLPGPEPHALTSGISLLAITSPCADRWYARLKMMDILENKTFSVCYESVARKSHARNYFLITIV
ncbi:hypothetical protein AGR8A_Lc20093 [Agrobacterium fabrum str. J-07]|nr:hypothetical protein AGR8A_Lc20093 [Agrobacterium fabrum str. J-07]